ncbi:MAG: TonB-dependent receptor plug domain-containing protein, partial [Gemmatimonadaceae bacterium]
MVGFAVLLGVVGSAQAQAPTTVKGRVVSESGAPLPGASVVFDAFKAGSVTGDDGTFTFSVPGTRRGNAVLSVRRIGYKLMSMTLDLNGTTITQNFTMVPQALQLTGVIVSALSIQREKSTVGTSQQQISNEELTRTQTPSLINAMSGKLSGVAITGNGNVGGSARIVIRGQSSLLGNNQPLFIVDGVPVSNAGFSTASASGGRDYGTAISDINADDIASMTVLKGPNAAALYGSRAANGAVVISTKSGRTVVEGTKVTFTTRMTMDDMSIFPKYQNQYGQGFGGEFQYVDGAGSGTNDGADESWGPKLDGRLIDQFTGKAQPWVAHPNNVRDFFRLGSTASNTLSLVNATGKSNLRMAVTKENTAGIVPNSGLAKLV